MLKFQKIDPKNKEQALAFISWYSDPVMIDNWLLQSENSSVNPGYSVDQFQNDFSKSDKTAFMIKEDSEYIGYGSFYLNHPIGMQKEGKVCWPSIGIGNKEHRGKGLGIEICKEILRLSKDIGCTHIEAAIFEFNSKIKKILLKNGFYLIGEVENKTFVNGKWWKSEHYLKELND